MSDDTKDRGPADRARVNVHESWELSYWSEKFGVSAEQLKESVKRVGPMAVDVQRDLGK